MDGDNISVGGSKAGKKKQEKTRDAETKTPSRGGRFCEIVAERTGLEPATPGVTGRYSNQLNYRSSYSFRKMVGGDGIEPPTLCL